jgi:hypothetical protein
MEYFMLSERHNQDSSNHRKCRVYWNGRGKREQQNVEFTVAYPRHKRNGHLPADTPECTEQLLTYNDRHFLPFIVVGANRKKTVLKCTADKQKFIEIMSFSRNGAAQSGCGRTVRSHGNDSIVHAWTSIG